MNHFRTGRLVRFNPNHTYPQACSDYDKWQIAEVCCTVRRLAGYCCTAHTPGRGSAAAGRLRQMHPRCYRASEGAEQMQRRAPGGAEQMQCAQLALLGICTHPQLHPHPRASVFGTCYERSNATIRACAPGADTALRATAGAIPDTVLQAV